MLELDNGQSRSIGIAVVVGAGPGPQRLTSDRSRVGKVFTAVHGGESEILMIRSFTALDIALSRLLVVVPGCGLRERLFQVERVRVGLLEYLDTSFWDVRRPSLLHG